MGQFLTFSLAPQTRYAMPVAKCIDENDVALRAKTEYRVFTNQLDFAIGGDRPTDASALEHSISRCACAHHAFHVIAPHISDVVVVRIHRRLISSTTTRTGIGVALPPPTSSPCTLPLSDTRHVSFTLLTGHPVTRHSLSQALTVSCRVRR